PGGPALGAVSGVSPAAGAQMVLRQSPLPPPHLHRTPADHRRPLGAPHTAAGPAPRGPRRGPPGYRRGAPRPAAGPGSEPQHPAARTAPATAARLAHTAGAGGGRFRPAQTPHVWHGAHRSGTPPARRPAPGPRERHVRAVAPGPPWRGGDHAGSRA